MHDIMARDIAGFCCFRSRCHGLHAMRIKAFTFTCIDVPKRYTRFPTPLLRDYKFGVCR